LGTINPARTSPWSLLPSQEAQLSAAYSPRVLGIGVFRNFGSADRSASGEICAGNPRLDWNRALVLGFWWSDHSLANQMLGASIIFAIGGTSALWREGAESKSDV
jgi:hypothetical protein